MRAYAFLLLTACTCTAASPPAENEMQAAAPVPVENEMQTAEHHLAPAWQAGDTWTVRYRFRVLSMVNARDPPPAFAVTEWVYTVVDRDAEAVHISAYSEEKWIWHFTFAPNGRLLSVRDPWGEDPFDAVADEPVVVLGDRGLREGASTWPRFPLEEDFGLDDSGLQQRSHPAGSELEVTLVRAGHHAGLGDLVRTATQRWQAGRPWWSILRIEEEYTGREGTTTTIKIEGEVIAWPASTP